MVGVSGSGYVVTNAGRNILTQSYALGSVDGAAINAGDDNVIDYSTMIGSVRGLYLFGALGNLWGTRGRHPGWLLLAAAVILIAFGISKPAN